MKANFAASFNIHSRRVHFRKTVGPLHTSTIKQKWQPNIHVVGTSDVCKITALKNGAF